MASIRFENIDKFFPGVQALKNINLEIKSGEFFTLLGPSGCGKTTLLRTVAGFYKQDRGHIYFEDVLVDDIPAHKRDTGMVFQNYAVWPHMTVYENVAFGLKNRKLKPSEIKRKVDTVLKMARLTGFEHRTPDQLSGGQQQRVGLARAMVIEPKVLLMDEPLSNLDAKLRIEMREEIRDIQRQLGITTIYVTHDQEEALVISDRIAVMNAGEIYQVGEPWEIYKNPSNIFVASFVGTMNFLSGKIISRNGDSVTIDFGIGKLNIKVSRSLPTSGEIRIAVRPEDLILEPRASEIRPKKEFSVIKGRIIKSSFTGTLIQYFVECDSGKSLIIERHKPEKDALIQDGTSVEVLIPKKAVFLFDQETGKRV